MRNKQNQEDTWDFDHDIIKLKEWVDEKERLMNAETLEKASKWVHHVARSYRERYHAAMPLPTPLPCSYDELILEWMGKDGVDICADLDADIYGKNDETKEEIHLQFPLNKTMNNKVIAFIYKARKNFQSREEKEFEEITGMKYPS